MEPLQEIPEFFLMYNSDGIVCKARYGIVCKAQYPHTQTSYHNEIIIFDMNHKYISD